MVRITRHPTDDRFSVVTDTVMADGNFLFDGEMQLVGNELKAAIKTGHIRIGGGLRIKLGAISYARVTSLAGGEEVTF